VAPRSEDTNLIIRVINFELVQPVRPGYINVTDRQTTDGRTDGRTNGRTTYDSNTALALRASRGKNFSSINVITVFMFRILKISVIMRVYCK